jgi:hypothetical protein
LKAINNKNFPESQLISSPCATVTGEFFYTPVRSDFGTFLNDIVAFWWRHPQIRLAFARDLELGALADKRLRQQDHAFELARTAPLFNPAETDTITPDTPGLSAGRPRTPDLVVFIAAMSAGFNGSAYGASARTLLLESTSLHSLLADLGHKLPAANTLAPLVARLSPKTLEQIHRAQLAELLDEGLDTFQDLTIDSTAIKASTCWPTDANLIYRLMERSARLGEKVTHFGLTPLKIERKELLLNELKNNTRAIALLGASPHRAKRLRLLYDRFYETACKLAHELRKGMQTLLSNAQSEIIKLKPSQREAARLLVNQVCDDSGAAISTICQSLSRVHDGISTKAREKVLSLADASAAYIEKGGREAVIGYKPQLARSAAGFVTALILETGNGADCRQLFALVKQTAHNTGLVPTRVSADDGYASEAGLKAVQALGVNKVSISGSKGRALLGAEVWDQPEYSELRGLRSGIESLIFTLKFNHDFGRPGRRGVAAVRAELTLKILAYNFDQAVRIRARKRAPERIACAA